MNGHVWRVVAAGITIAGVTALWTGNARLASLETGLKNLGQQVDFFTNVFNDRLLYLERQPRPTAFREPRDVERGER